MCRNTHCNCSRYNMFMAYQLRWH